MRRRIPVLSASRRSEIEGGGDSPAAPTIDGFRVDGNAGGGGVGGGGGGGGRGGGKGRAGRRRLGRALPPASRRRRAPRPADCRGGPILARRDYGSPRRWRARERP